MWKLVHLGGTTSYTSDFENLCYWTVSGYTCVTTEIYTISWFNRH